VAGKCEGAGRPRALFRDEGFFADRDEFDLLPLQSGCRLQGSDGTEDGWGAATVRAGRTCGQCQSLDGGGQEHRCRRMMRDRGGLGRRGARMEARAEVADGGLLARWQRVAAVLVTDAGDQDRDQDQGEQQRLGQPALRPALYSA
jgi:hypothetical protein